jgi:hypothetical protein
VTSSRPAPTVLIERNAAVRRRLERVLLAATALEPVLVLESPEQLETLRAARPALIACEAQDASRLVGWLPRELPFSRLLVWTPHSSPGLFRLALEQPRFSHVLGWPGFASMPRPWELLLVARRLLGAQSSPPSLRDMLGWGSTVVEWHPRTSRERDTVVAQVQEHALRISGSQRLAERVAETAHELLMNAMYDAPRDALGAARYAQDRRQELTLEAHEVPIFRLCTDGLFLALQAVDPFGALTRRHLFGGLVRGLEGAGQTQAAQVLDTSSGGAGLGMLKMYDACSILVADVEPGRRTEMTAFWELDANPREMRDMPRSVHFFER